MNADCWRVRRFGPPFYEWGPGTRSNNLSQEIGVHPEISVNPREQLLLGSTFDNSQPAARIVFK